MNGKKSCPVTLFQVNSRNKSRRNLSQDQKEINHMKTNLQSVQKADGEERVAKVWRCSTNLSRYATILFSLALSTVPAAAQPYGEVFHTIRSPGGAWQVFGDVKSQAGNPGYVYDVSATANTSTGELHLVASTYYGELFHTIRYTDGTWQFFGYVEGQTGNPGFATRVAATINSATGDLHLVVATSNNGLFHTIRHANGVWDAFGDVKGQAGNPGQIADISAAVDSSTGDLQLAVATSNYGLFHVIRHANGAWDKFADVKGQSGNPRSPWGSLPYTCGDSVSPGARVGTALIGHNLHLVASGPDGGLFHTIRYSSGYWQPFFDAAGVTDPGFVCDISAAGNDSTGELQVVVITSAQLVYVTPDTEILAGAGEMRPWLATRASDTSWGPFVDVIGLGQTGDPTSGWGYANVGISLVGDSLHLVTATRDAAKIVVN